MDDVASPPASDDGHPIASVEHWPAGRGQLVKITGELDISNVESVRQAIELVTADRPAVLVFELSELRFIDSSGIALLLGAARAVGAVQMRNPSPAVRRVVEITGLGDALPLES
jgi:anti-sigma B factor antagonist